MTPAAGIEIAAAGVAAGLVNAVVGSGSLITFPLLLALGYPPVVANVSNNVGLVPASVGAAVTQRGELAGRPRLLVVVLLTAAVGGCAGGILLVLLPGSVFERVVPYLILVSVVLVVLRPRLAARVRARTTSRRPGRWADAATATSEPSAELRAGDVRASGGEPAPGLAPAPGWLPVALAAAAVYSGYFGAAVGVIILSVLAVALPEGIHRLNVWKNAAVGLSNATAAVVFVAVSHVAWLAVGILALASLVGGQLGVHVGRWIPPAALVSVVVVVGVVAAVALLVH
ncbi:MAG: sulfite exporter TauE/SafE family protein [Actinomycetota bacterium]|jgi:uncharacterized membrane protein YfcA|nr:sulfite exporter TauE/SafE family protein [Actinomycetota bacterium]MDA8294824.1 sulfite exporter TauE/SafE family protein [Actinomycetota bacterium]